MKTPQTPAEGITAFKAYPDMKTFRVSCECSCDNEMDMYIETEDGIITTGFDTKVKSHYWTELFKISYLEPWLILQAKTLINTIYHRLHVTWTVLTKGYVEMSTHILMTEQQTLNLAQILLDSVDALRKQNEEIKAKKEAKASAD